MFTKSSLTLKLSQAIVLPLLGLAIFSLSVTAQSASQPQKYGLFVGVNKYPNMGPAQQLNGCVSDATRMREALIREFSFSQENTELIADAQATRNGILGKIQAFQSKVKSGDLFVFHYSGHGSLFPDDKSEEQDETETLPEMRLPRTNELIAPPGKYDAAICPSDTGGSGSGKPWGNMILDDELFALFQGFTRSGCTVVFISDSCHSGSIGRSLDANYRVKSLPLTVALGTQFEAIPRPKTSREVRSRDLQGKYLVLASSKVTQVSGEIEVEGKPTGFFTYVLLKMIELQSKDKGKGKPTYQDVFVPSQAILLAKSPSKQEPQIDTRYFNGSLNEPMFSVGEKPAPAPSAPPVAANNTTAKPKHYRVVLKVENEAGQPLDKCSFIVFKPGMYAEKGNIRKEQALILGRTNAAGIYDGGADAPLVPSGTYQMKIVREGYKSIIGEVEVHDAEQKTETIVFVIRLEKE